MHEIQVNRKPSLFGVNLWEVVKITHFNNYQRIESVYKGLSLKNALKTARNERNDKTPSKLTIRG